MNYRRLLVLFVLSMILVLGLVGTAGANTAPEETLSSAAFSLILGESRTFTQLGMKIYFASVTEDTRGDASGEGELLRPAGAVTVVLLVWHADIVGPDIVELRMLEGGRLPSATLANGYRLTLHWVSPNPNAGEVAAPVPVPASEYEATFSLAAPIVSPVTEDVPSTAVEPTAMDRASFNH